jgi:hypothetical protein
MRRFRVQDGVFLYTKEILKLMQRAIKFKVDVLTEVKDFPRVIEVDHSYHFIVVDRATEV